MCCSDDIMDVTLGSNLCKIIGVFSSIGRLKKYVISLRFSQEFPVSNGGLKAFLEDFTILNDENGKKKYIYISTAELTATPP